MGLQLAHLDEDLRLVEGAVCGVEAIAVGERGGGVEMGLGLGLRGVIDEGPDGCPEPTRCIGPEAILEALALVRSLPGSGQGDPGPSDRLVRLHIRPSCREGRGLLQEALDLVRPGSDPIGERRRPERGEPLFLLRPGRQVGAMGGEDPIGDQEALRDLYDPPAQGLDATGWTTALQLPEDPGAAIHGIGVLGGHHGEVGQHPMRRGLAARAAVRSASASGASRAESRSPTSAADGKPLLSRVEVDARLVERVNWREAVVRDIRGEWRGRRVPSVPTGSPTAPNAICMSLTPARSSSAT